MKDRMPLDIKQTVNITFKASSTSSGFDLAFDLNPLIHTFIIRYYTMSNVLDLAEGYISTGLLKADNHRYS